MQLTTFLCGDILYRLEFYLLQPYNDVVYAAL